MCTYPRFASDETTIVIKDDWLDESDFFDRLRKVLDVRKVPPYAITDDNFVNSDFDSKGVEGMGGGS